MTADRLELALLALVLGGVPLAGMAFYALVSELVNGRS